MTTTSTFNDTYILAIKFSFLERFPNAARSVNDLTADVVLECVTDKDLGVYPAIDSVELHFCEEIDFWRKINHWLLIT